MHTAGRALWRVALGVALGAVTLPGVGCASRASKAPGWGEPLVALVSIGGFDAKALDPGPKGKPPMPTAAAFAARGVRADRVTPVTPAAVYPAHATLVTGARPMTHGVLADRVLGEQGISRFPVTQSNALRVQAIWQTANEAGLRVAALDWPTTRGAPISLLIPDTGPHASPGWVDSLRDGTPTTLLTLAIKHGGADPETARPGAARDHVLVDVACELFVAPKRPRLMLLHLSQVEVALEQYGPESREVANAYAGADRELARWLRCVRSAGQLESASVLLVGDVGYESVHTAIAPNVTLASEDLIVRAGPNVDSWEAIARSNGGSAFVYARGERPAVRARDALTREAKRTGAFRVLSADEMIAADADREAWFGLEAQPGYAFVNDATGELLRPAAVRAAAGYVVTDPALDPGFAAWGRGIRQGIRIPVMRQTDVAPTLARLLGLTLQGAEGHVLVGALEATESSPVGAGAEQPGAEQPGAGHDAH